MESSLDPNFDHSIFQHFVHNHSNKKGNITDPVAITFHIAEAIQGEYGLSQDILQSELNAVNNHFSNTDIEFFMCGAPRQISGEQSYTTRNADELNARNHIANTINIYLVNDVMADVFGIGGFAFFPWDPRDNLQKYIMIDRGTPNLAGVLSHEIGHFYGLYHTHTTLNGLELVNRSNCEFRGDLLCDTEADYNLALGGIDGCKYVGEVKDSNGDFYMPNPKNMMSYSSHRCISEFTLDQSNRMNFYHTRDLSYLKSECSFPDFLISSAEPSKSIRADEDIKIKYSLDLDGDIDLEEIEVYFWLSDDEAELGTIIQKETISLPPGSTSLDLDFNIDFPINRSTNTYFLTAQVDPEFKVLEQEEGNNLHTISVTVDNSALEDQVVFANPVSNNILKIFLRDKSTKTELNFYIWDHLGRLHKQVDVFKNREEYFEEIDVSSLADGLYILEAHFPDKGRSESFNFYKQSL